MTTALAAVRRFLSSPRTWRAAYRLTLAALLLALLATLVLLGPVLLGFAVASARARYLRGLFLPLPGLLLAAIAWTWRELRRLPGQPRGRWRECATPQCRRPIEAPGRARYCGPGCRRLARLEREAAGGDGRAAARLERLRRPAAVATHDEIPF